MRSSSLQRRKDPAQRRWVSILLCSLAILAAAPGAVSAAEAGRLPRAVAATADRAAASFGTFCQEWMQRLAKRTEDNLARIKWETDDQGVRGAYVGYSPEHACKMSETMHSAPTGKITYHEFRYEKRGPTISEATVSDPRPIEIFEVIEIFTFKNDRWTF